MSAAHDAESRNGGAAGGGRPGTSRKDGGSARSGGASGDARGGYRTSRRKTSRRFRVVRRGS